MDERDFELYDCQDENFDDRYFDGEDLDKDALFALWEIDPEDLDNLDLDELTDEEDETF